MKRILLFLFFLAALSQARASDTLTVRQVYNFNVGDTFDYATKDLNYDFNLFSIAYSRVVITQKTLSITGDTLIYNGNWLITNLDSVAVFRLDTITNPSPILLLTDTSTYSGYLSNQITTNNVDGGTGYMITDSLGLTETYASFVANDPYYTNSHSKDLIYHSNGAQSFGTPYYITDQQGLVHYTPLPESCAVWTMISPGPPPTYDTLYEQIRTGNIIDTNGHRYVEMIYRSYDKYTGYTITDSLIGYFINVTGAVLFADSLSETSPYVFYDFDLVQGSPLGEWYVTNLYRDTVGGVVRTHWVSPQPTNTYYSPSYIYNNKNYIYNNKNYIYNDYAEGIGSMAGLISVHTAYGIPLFTSRLVSLCVCGNIIYPDTVSGQSCILLTGINNINPTTRVSIYLYPNPTTDQLHLSITDTRATNVQFIITDILGQQVYISTISQSETRHDITGLSAGIYTWKLVTDGTTIKTGKVVKQ